MSGPVGAGLEAVAMIPVDGESQRLRELHELYVWQVNAAVEEGRDDLVAELADEYLEAALAEMAAGRPADTGATGPDVGPTGLDPGGSDVEPTHSAGSAPWDVLDCRPTGRSWWRRLLRR
jgi:hypothetical protein